MSKIGGTGDKDHQEDVGEGDNELPPLDHDELVEVDPGELADLIDPVADVGFLDEDGDDRAEEEISVARELIDDAEASWLDERAEEAAGGDEAAAADEDKDELALFEDTDEQGDWVGGENDAGGMVDGGWFVPEEEETSTEDDGGSEGPVGDESFELHEPEWNESDTEDEGDDEGVLDAMARLGIALPEPELDDTELVAPAMLMDVQYLGPELGSVSDATFLGGSPIAIGDAFYVLGADGMLHPVLGSHSIADKGPASLFTWGDRVFIGTERGGVLSTADRGTSFATHNGWYVRGLRHTETPPAEQLSTTFEIRGQLVPDGCRLLGRTEEGHLFASDDGGDNWQGPLSRNPCLALSPIAGERGVALLADAGDGVYFETSEDLHQWHRTRLPERMSDLVSEGGAYLTASIHAVAVGVGVPCGRLFCSLNRGEEWQEIESKKPITAAAFDPDTPGWMVVSDYDDKGKRGRLKVSEDGGLSWVVVLTTDSSAAHSLRKGVVDYGKITALALHVGSTRQVLVTETGGVHLVTLSRPGVSH